MNKKYLSLLKLGIVIILSMSLFFLNTLIGIVKPKPVLAVIPLDNYCRAGYYYININNPNEVSCSRAPLCGGKSYSEVEQLPQPNPQACMGDGKEDRATKGCAGLVPLCCYEVERTRDPMRCIGYWERLWCHPDQCAKIDPEKGRDCNNGQPGTCKCGDAIKSWCIDTDKHSSIPYISIEQRLGVSPTNTGIPPSATNPPATTATPTPTPTFPPCRTSPVNPKMKIVFQVDRIANPVNFNNSGGLQVIGVNFDNRCQVVKNNIDITYDSGLDFFSAPFSLPIGNNKGYDILLMGPRNLRQKFGGIKLNATENEIDLDCTVDNPPAGCGELITKREEKKLWAGDANQDGVVNVLDFELYRQNVGNTASGNNTDFDYNGKVEYKNGVNDDFILLKNNFGKSGIFMNYPISSPTPSPTLAPP